MMAEMALLRCAFHDNSHNEPLAACAMLKKSDWDDNRSAAPAPVAGCAKPAKLGTFTFNAVEAGAGTGTGAERPTPVLLANHAGDRPMPLLSFHKRDCSERIWRGDVGAGICCGRERGDRDGRWWGSKWPVWECECRIGRCECARETRG